MRWQGVLTCDSTGEQSEDYMLNYWKMLIVVALTLCWVKSDAEPHPALLAAEALTLTGAADAAITEYKRYLFFNPDSPAVPVHLAIAGLFKSIGKYAEAQVSLQSALLAAANDSLRDEIRIKSAVIAIVQGKHSAAQGELTRIASFSPNLAIRERAELFLCIGLLFAGSWDEAEKIAINGATSGNRRMLRLDSLLRCFKPAHRKSPLAARWMSTFLPGLGQIYAHEVFEGFNALAISLFTGYLTAQSIAGGYYPEAILTDGMLVGRYYSGNRWHAKDAAERYNAKIEGDMREKVIEQFLQE